MTKKNKVSSGKALVVQHVNMMLHLVYTLI